MEKIKNLASYAPSPLLLLLAVYLSTLTGVAEGGVASECAIWGGVASALQRGSHAGADAKCDVTDACTGLSCSGLSEAAATSSSSGGVSVGSALGFSVEILPCSYPLVMRVVVERTDAPRFSQTISIQNSGHRTLSLPPGKQSSDGARELNLAWISTLVPIRYQVDLQVNYTVLSHVTGAMLPSNQLDRFALVPRILVPVPDCYTFDVAPTPGLPTGSQTPGIQTTTPPGAVTEINPLKPLSLQPLWVGVGLASFILLVLVIVLIQRLSSTHSAHSPYKHSKLVNDYSADGHMIQV